MDEDITLIEKYLEGDEYAVEELVIKYQRKIYALAYRMTWSIDDSKDITQKTFMQAFKNIKGFRRTSAFYTWLYQIALNTCRNHLNRKNRETTEIDESYSGNNGNALSAIIDNEEQSLLKNALEKLPERQKTAIILRAYQGLSLRETSEVMKCSAGAVKAHYHNGMKKLKGILKEREYGFRS
jgi:RNA polymerase sigma-70 factor (ECF subfamily)